MLGLIGYACHHNGSYFKKYYENHKEEIIKKVMEYKEKNKDKKADPEKIKEYNRRAYLKRKEKNIGNN